ncbi:winged helix-turn-helix domain-containing protein [Candidatus Xianfuyuplasma coldseepsis]|uniref:Helix-turn-helix transcriptional regulator n=1 Tax=Candidatus Xianfuyuplasma coldseepsis TaxID=2782163 RepID=A0A7L7KQZ3_9MOLU|nr:winged helix-turn-helix domain-containing protein [Xianfuyuplasma coldseepsis]QMS84702.1 helix-turn-helix transcriptional regulator [Xianfuyuplasma coldseepsis]
MDDVRIISTTEELEILSNPFRLSIINTFREHGEPLTVKGCADLMNEVPAKVHYHMKKLLKINVFELDHIEVINGINAKYYYLPKVRFSLQIKASDEETLKTNVKHLMNLSISQMESFKLDFIDMTQKATKLKEQNPYKVGWLSNNKIYLSEEEYDELQQLLIDFIMEHDKKDETKRKYSFLMGISYKED